MLNYQQSKENQNKYDNTILSMQKPKTILNITTTTDNGLQTRLQQKSKLIVYIKDNSHYIERSSAYALGLINTRAIMLKNNDLVEIPLDKLNIIKRNENIEIEYKNLVSTNEKPKLQVFVDGQYRCISMAAAYSLNLIDEKEFYSVDSSYYYINDNMLNSFSDKYDIEYASLSLEQYNNNKNI